MATKILQPTQHQRVLVIAYTELRICLALTERQDVVTTPPKEWATHIVYQVVLDVHKCRLNSSSHSSESSVQLTEMCLTLSN